MIMLTEDTAQDVQGRVTRISSEPKTAAKGGYLFRGLELCCSSDSTRVFILFPIFVGDDLYEFPLLCWEGALVAAFKLQLNNRLEDGSLIYTASPESELILEPYRPVSVTEAVEAASCIRAADARYRVGPDEPYWMAKGKLIHTLFDHLLQIRDEQPEDVFREGFRKALPDFMAVLPGSGVSSNRDELEKEARKHFDNLRSWLEANKSAFASAQVELDVISARWGLKGRADAILWNQPRRTVVELKTGKALTEDHMAQLYAYTLLLGESHEASAVDGHVIYSATGMSKSLHEDTDSWHRAILEGRNRVVALKHSYTFGGEPHTQEPCPRQGRCFARAACKRLFQQQGTRNHSSLTAEQLTYYSHWFRLLSLETWAEETEFARVLDRETLGERVEEGRSLPVRAVGIREKTSGHADAHADQHSENEPGAGKAHPILELDLESGAGDIASGEEVVLHQGNPCAGNALRGRVVPSDDGGRVLVKLRGSAFADPRHDAPSSQWGTVLQGAEEWFVDRMPFMRAREVARHSLYAFFVRADRKVVEVVVQADPSEQPTALSRDSESKRPIAPVLGQGSDGRELLAKEGVRPEQDSRSSGLRDLCFGEGLQGELNEDQEAAVEAALSSDPFHLVHGPPGTGKTRVLARLIRMCLDRGERVLVACPTNVALDRLMISVMSLGVRDFLRIGRRSTVSRDFMAAVQGQGNPAVLLEDVCSHHDDFRKFREHVSGIRLMGATAYQVASHPLFLKQRFDRVIVDEAGQLDEPSTLGALLLAPRFVLGGDHLQLPPVVKVRSSESSGNETSGLEQSLFERLVRSSPESGISRLRVQYRMNQEVQDIPSRLFYDGRLVPFPDVASRRLNLKPGASDHFEINRIIDPEVPVVFVDVSGSESGKASPQEALVASRIVESLVVSGVPSNEIGIITPYRAQQALIRGHLSEARRTLPRVAVDTVDRFQGGEREVIILSLARSDGVTSFLADRKRLNVSLSRARSKLILLGNGAALGEHPLFTSILEGLERVPVTVQR